LQIDGLESRIVPALDQIFDPEAIVSQYYFATSCAYFNTDQEEAQTFTVGMSGTLSEVDLYLSTFSGSIGDLIVDIRACQGDGRPTSGAGQQLVSVTIPAATVSANVDPFLAIDLTAANLYVSAGEKLAVIAHVAPDVNGDITYYWGGRPDNYYAGGGFTDRVIGNYDWQAVDPIDDIGFKTYVIPAVSLPPIVTLPAGPSTFTENGAATNFATIATVTDADTPIFDTGTLTASLAVNGTVDDRIAIRNQGTGAGQIGVSGNTVSFAGSDIGTFSGGVGTTPLTVNLNNAATIAATQALVQNLTFSNVSDNPSTAIRTLRVVLTDGQGGTSRNVTTTVTVQATDDPPAVSTNAGLTLSRGTTAVITQADLETSDVDNTAGQLIYSVMLTPTHGTILLSGTPTSTFTQADINNGLVAYQHDGTLTTIDSFSFKVSDGTLTTSTTLFAITILSNNAAPTVTTNTGLAVNIGTSATISQSMLETTDPDNTPAQLTYSISSGPTHGALLLSGLPTATFTQADINAGNIQYANNGSASATDSFTFTVSDGQAATTATTFNINVTIANQAPTLMVNAGRAVIRGAATVIRHVDLDTADPDNTSSQLVYTVGSGPAHGTMQLNAVSATTFTQADIDAGRVSYLNDGTAFTSDSFNFTVSDGTATTSPATFELAVDTVPVITLSPLDKSAFAGSPVTLSANATGVPNPKVQWQVKAPGGSFVNVTGATSKSFTFVPTTADNGNQYQAIFSNAVGSDTSSPATLTVTPGLVILSSPKSQTVALGQTATFIAGATGSTKTSVQWQISTDGGVTYANITGATKPTLSVKKISAAQDGALYRAVFHNAAGAAASVAATLSVNYTVTLTGKQAIAVRPGTTMTLAIQAKAVPTAVQWQVSVDLGHTWTDIGGATGDIYSFAAVTGDSGHQFRANVTSAGKTKASAAATLTVLDLPDGTGPDNLTIGAGGTAVFTASPSLPSTKLQWQVSTDGGLTYTNIRGATKGTLTLKKVKALMNGYVFRVVFLNAVGVAQSDSAMLTVT
jgi:hypothetical protein